ILAFILADAGFDVFLINHRGGHYSKRHISLKPWDNQYWQCSVDELSRYDAPAAIDKVLEVTGYNGTYWVGHSMGTSIAYMGLSTNPQYNSKIKSAFLMAPSGSAGYGQGPAKLLFWAYKTFEPLVHVSLDLKMGIQSEQALTCDKSQTRAPVYLSHAPSGTSTWNLLHYAQPRISHPLQETPPPYNFSSITAPIYHFWSRNDILQTREEIEKTIMSTLPQETVKEWIEIPEYNHFDYALAVDCAEKVFNPITRIVRSQETGMC
ncbi:hypothetical protein PENTCL1PPCAC_24650, partial [Pristionchus entomophagus]